MSLKLSCRGDLRTGSVDKGKEASGDAWYVGCIRWKRLLSEGGDAVVK